MRDLLLRSIFVKQKIFFLQTADDACSVLLQHQRVNSDQIDVYLYDFRRRRDRGRLVRTVTINDFGKLLVRVDSSVSCLRSDRRMRREKENCNDERGNCNEKKKCRVSMLHKRSPSRKQCCKFRHSTLPPAYCLLVFLGRELFGAMLPEYAEQRITRVNSVVSNQRRLGLIKC